MSLEVPIEWKGLSGWFTCYFLSLMSSLVYLCSIWPLHILTLPESGIYFKGKLGDVTLLPMIDLLTFFTKIDLVSVTTKSFSSSGCRRRPLAQFQDQSDLPSPSNPKCNHQRSKHKTDLTSVSRGKYILNLVPHVAHMELLPVSLDIKCEADFLISRLFDHRTPVKLNVWYKLYSGWKSEPETGAVSYIYCAFWWFSKGNAALYQQLSR